MFVMECWRNFEFESTYFACMEFHVKPYISNKNLTACQQDSLTLLVRDTACQGHREGRGGGGLPRGPTKIEPQLES